MRHILLATVGLAPQVITETLFSLHESSGDWPDEIHVITSRQGRELIENRLLREGVLASMCAQLGRPQPLLLPAHINVPTDAKGRDVEDPRSPAEQAALADAVLSTVRMLTRDEETTLHASLAGGRKTMAFYLGYAMSLFGRPGDVLSHVLVSDPSYENGDFWYPQQPEQEVRGRDGESLNARDAKLVLASIPFVRQREELPGYLLSDQGDEGLSFEKIVRLVNAANNSGAIQVVLRLKRGAGKAAIQLFDKDVLVAQVPLTLMQASIMAMFLHLMKEQAEPVDLQLDEDKRLTGKPREYFLMYLFGQAGAIGSTEREKIDYIGDEELIDPKTVTALMGRDLGQTELKGVTGSLVSDWLNKTKKAMASQLPARLVEQLLPSASRRVGYMCPHFYQGDGEKGYVRNDREIRILWE